MDLDEALELERAVWRALVAGDPGADRDALAMGFLGVYPDGFAGREEHAAQLDTGPTVLTYALSDARILPLGPDHVLLAYRATYTRPATPDDPETMYVSSIWARTGQGWENVFSQDTPARP